MRIFIFGFNNISGEIVSKLNSKYDKYVVGSNLNSIIKFVQNTNFDSYDYVIGCGSYSGRGSDFIRIEKSCTSQFRNNKTNLEVIAIPYFFEPNDCFKLANGIGNSWCNLVSYLILKKSPDIKYTFLHIPKMFDSKMAIKAINDQLLL